MKGNFLAAADEAIPEVIVSRAVLDIPLASGHDFEWFVTFLEKLHRVHHGIWLTLQVARFLQELDDGGFGTKDSLSRQL